MGISGVAGRKTCIRCGGLYRPTSLNAYCKDCQYDMQQIALAKQAAAERERRAGKKLHIHIPDFYLRQTDEES